MRVIAGLIMVALLAACGADGAPTPPEPKQDPSQSGITISGQACVGVVYSSTGGTGAAKCGRKG